RYRGYLSLDRSSNPSSCCPGTIDLAWCTRRTIPAPGSHRFLDGHADRDRSDRSDHPTSSDAVRRWDPGGYDHLSPCASLAVPARRRPGSSSIIRSEEHTSELQSRFDLVCRLLLEK